MYLLYKDFETVYRAYTWVVYGYGLVKWVVGYRKHPSSRFSREDGYDDRFLVIDAEGGELDLIETHDPSSLTSDS